MFGRHAASSTVLNSSAAPLRWQQPGASTSGRLSERQDVLWLAACPQTCRSAPQSRPRTLRVTAATEEATSSAATARQKVLDSVRESLARRAASGGGGQRAASRPVSRQ